MAHRGGAGLWPENTMLAFERARELGVDVIEMDVHATADGVLVVLHDANVDRTTDGAGRVGALTLSELKKLDAGYPLLSRRRENIPLARARPECPDARRGLHAVACHALQHRAQAGESFDS